MQRLAPTGERPSWPPSFRPTLRLQADHTNRPYGGGWWPGGEGDSHELLDLMGRWPADRPSIASYAYLHDDWDRSEAAVPARYRTRTLILMLNDRSSCRLLLIPTDTNPDVAEESWPRPATRCQVAADGLREHLPVGEAADPRRWRHQVSDLRLTMGAAAGKDRLDGGWWPHSRDLSTELADLVDSFPVGVRAHRPR